MSYIVEVGGKYYVTDGQGKVTYKPYSLRFRLANADKPLSDVVKYLLKDGLQKRYPEAEGYVTHHLEHIHDEENPEKVVGIPVMFMDRSQLKAFCAVANLGYVKLPEEVALDVLRVEVQVAHEKGDKAYKDVVSKREALTNKAQSVLSGAELLEDDPTPQDSEKVRETGRETAGMGLVEGVPAEKPKRTRKRVEELVEEEYIL